jgi:hypothetical protein
MQELQQEKRDAMRQDAEAAVARETERETMLALAQEKQKKREAQQKKPHESMQMVEKVQGKTEEKKEAKKSAARAVRHSVVSRDALLCADSVAGSAVEFIGQTCGADNDRIVWKSFRTLHLHGPPLPPHRLCGLPGSTPPLHEYLGSCGVAPTRLPHLPTRVCAGEAPGAGCLPASQLQTECRPVCGLHNKELTQCNTRCRPARRCERRCLKHGRVCRVRSRRVCKRANIQGKASGFSSGTEQQVQCRAAPFGRCSWRQCKRGAGQEFWFGKPRRTHASRMDSRSVSPDECL